jgi:alkylhydroperoxidase family enzyme
MEAAMARVPLVRPEEATGSTRDTLERQQARTGYALNIARALANLPPAMERVFGLAGWVLSESPLDPVLRELAILTVGRLTGATYEYEHHVEMALRVGVTRGQVAALNEWAASPLFDACQRAVMRYAWQATAYVRVADSVAEAVRQHLNDEQFMALVVTVACYNMVARILEPLQVELEEEFIQGRQ